MVTEKGQDCFRKQETVPHLFTVLREPPKECTQRETNASDNGDPFFKPVRAASLTGRKGFRRGLRTRLKLDGPDRKATTTIATIPDQILLSTL